MPSAPPRARSAPPRARRFLGLVLAAVAACLSLLATGHLSASSTATVLCSSNGGGVAFPSESFTVRSGGRSRSVLLHVPEKLRTPAPLVLAFHGGGNTGPQMEALTGLSKLADSAGFLVAYPTATGPHRYWNTAARPDARNADDAAFVDDLMKDLVAGGCVDRRRISAVGLSNGGGLAARLGCEQPGYFAAIVVVAGTYGSLPGCRPPGPVSMLEIHGTADASVPYNGSPENDRRGSVARWMSLWARRDGCSTPPSQRTVAPATIRFDWPRCARRTAVAHLEIVGGQHAWPGSTPPGRGPASSISAAQEAWRFAASRRLFPRR